MKSLFRRKLPEPTPEQQAYTDKLAQFLHLLSVGRIKALYPDGTPVDASVWKHRNAALLFLSDDKARSLRREIFGARLEADVLVEPFDSELASSPEIVSRFSPAFMARLRRHYHLGERPSGLS